MEPLTLIESMITTTGRPADEAMGVAQTDAEDFESSLIVVKDEQPKYQPETSADRRRTKENKQVDQSSFLLELENQTGEERQRGRIAVLDLINDPETNSKKCELKSWTMKSCDLEEQGLLSENTQLVIIEDLGASWVQPVAKWLHIPEHVFALHCAHPEDHLLGKVCLPLGSNPQEHFILQYLQPLPFKVRKGGLKNQDLACTAKRTLIHRINAFNKDQQLGDTEAVEQLISYYCGNRNGRKIGKS